MNFDYLASKIHTADFRREPFKYIYIEDFFNSDDFARLISSTEINLQIAESDKDLIDRLHQANYRPIMFPGTTADTEDYLSWHQTKNTSTHSNDENCEGFGMTFRLQNPADDFLTALLGYLNSPGWLAAIAEKFEISQSEVTSDYGLQKYLDGYEISPHPDIRKKALTYMVNINPAPNSEEIEHHTHYMSFLPERKYIETFWMGNPTLDRCWVPWSWCTTITEQRKNNSIVLFQPAHNTLHAVRANYDHLKTQRTQLYGNLWYKDVAHLPKPTWRDFDIGISKGLRAREK